MHRYLSWGAPEYVLRRQQWVPQPVAEVFTFFADPHNLARITPRWLGFHIVAMQPPTMRAGTLITYRMRWFGVAYRWRTLIAEWVPDERFVDLQLNGPYILWHHTHTFEECRGGTLMKDCVHYRLPFGPWGVLLHRLIVKRQLDAIFDYRMQKTAAFLAAKD